MSEFNKISTTTNNSNYLSKFFCCQIWTGKNNSRTEDRRDVDFDFYQPTYRSVMIPDENDHSTGSAASVSSSSSSSSAAAASSKNSGRIKRFCKNFLIRRSRSMNDTRRSIDRDEERSNQQSHLISGEFATNTEEELKRLVGVITRLLERLSDQPDDIPALGDDECVGCRTSRASMQTFPCGHKVLCKTCFVRTIQVALQDRQLPLRCVVCRSRVVRLKQQSAPCPVVVLQQREPPGSYYVPQTPSPLPSSGIRRPGYM